MSKILDNNCLACKNRSDIFTGLNEDELNGLDCDRVSIVYNPGEIIFKQGAPCNNFVCVTSGLVKLYIEYGNSHNVILGLIRPVNYIFEPGAFSDKRHHFTAVACEETKACLIDLKVMQEIIGKNPEFANEFIKKISFQSIDLFKKISSYTQKHVYGRIADLLMHLYRDVYEINPFLLTISRQDIADLSGMTKESAIRVLKKFKDDNIISMEGNEVTIIDHSKLEAISKNG